MKGLLVERGAGFYIVLTPAGEYRRIKGSTSVEIGQEVIVRRVPAAARAASLAAALLMVIILGEAILRVPVQSNVYGYVTLDVNPSAAFAIDRESIVIYARAFNQEAERVLAGMPCKDQRIEHVLADFTRRALSLEYIGEGEERRILVSFYAEEPQTEQSAADRLAAITARQREVLEAAGPVIELETLVVDQETWREAEALGVSAGRLKEQKRAAGKDRSDPQRAKDPAISPQELQKGEAAEDSAPTKEKPAGKSQTKETNREDEENPGKQPQKQETPDKPKQDSGAKSKTPVDQAAANLNAPGGQQNQSSAAPAAASGDAVQGRKKEPASEAAGQKGSARGPRQGQALEKLKRLFQPQ